MLGGDNTNEFHLGTSTTFPEYLTYCLDTDESDYVCHMKRSVSPHDHVGHIECQWTILAGENEEPGEGDVSEIDNPGELLGKSWTGMLQISQALDLPFMVDHAYVKYSFWSSTGLKTFMTRKIETVTHSPKFEYSYKHHIPVVTQEFIDFLEKPLHFYLYVSPCTFVEYAKTNGLQPISRKNETITKKIECTISTKDDPDVEIRALAHRVLLSSTRATSGLQPISTNNESTTKNLECTISTKDDPDEEVRVLAQENELLKHLCEDNYQEICRLKAELFWYAKKDSSAKKKLEKAKQIDAAVESIPNADKAGSYFLQMMTGAVQ